MSAVHRKLRPLRHDVTVFTSTVNQTHMMPPDCLECTSTCRFKKKVLSFHACNHPIRRRRKKKKKSPFVIVPHEFFILRTEQRQMAPSRTTTQQRWGGGSVFRQSDQNFQEKNVLKVLTHQAIRDFRWRIVPVHTEHEANMHRKLAKQLKFGARAEGETMESDYVFK